MNTKTNEIFRFFYDNLTLTEKGDNYLRSRNLEIEVIDKYNLKSIDNSFKIVNLLLRKFNILDLIESGLFDSNNDFVFNLPCIIFPFIKNDEFYNFTSRNYLEEKEHKFSYLSNIDQAYYFGEITRSDIFLFESIIDAISFYQLTQIEDFIVAVNTDLIKVIDDFEDYHFGLVYKNDAEGKDRYTKAKNHSSSRLDAVNYDTLKKYFHIDLDDFRDINDLISGCPWIRFAYAKKRKIPFKA